MMQLIDFEILEKEKDEESGDIYYKIVLDLIDPGAAFKE